MKKSVVGIIMGSDSDLPVMKKASEIFEDFGIPYELEVISAHRTPDEMVRYAKTAHARGIRVIIAGAGGSAHLPGMTASFTPLPVIGVPIETHALQGLDSLLSIVQMPPGIPVATVAVNGSVNAALLAVEILGISSPAIHKKIIRYKKDLDNRVKEKAAVLKKIGWKKYIANTPKKRS